MHRTVIIPATLPAAALAELKDWLGISIAADDAALTALLRSAIDVCEGFTGLMPLVQTCTEVLPVRTDWQRLSVRPVEAITLVQGLPTEGAGFVLPPAGYDLELDSEGCGLVRVTSPGIAGRISVQFSAGLAPDWAGLPDGLRHGILRLAAHQYRHREAESSGSLPPAAVAALWQPWRRPRLT